MRRSDRSHRDFNRGPNRVFRRSGEWFFRTRESERGPFSDKESARRELDQYVETMSFFEDQDGELKDRLNLQDVTVVDLDTACEPFVRVPDAEDVAPESKDAPPPEG